MAKLNVFIRDRNCEIIKNDQFYHVHVYNCLGTEIQSTPLIYDHKGHVELAVAPGCYLVTAGVKLVKDRGNFYTDLAMVVVRCGDDACVNLILNGFQRHTPFVREVGEQPLQLIKEGCAGRMVIPLMLNAAKAKCKHDEIEKTLDVLYKAANLDKEQVIIAVQAEIKEMKAAMRGIKEKDALKALEEDIRILEENLSPKSA